MAGNSAIKVESKCYFEKMVFFLFNEYYFPDLIILTGREINIINDTRFCRSAIGARFSPDEWYIPRQRLATS